VLKYVSVVLVCLFIVVLLVGFLKVGKMRVDGSFVF